jgi:hypothetical protein
MKHGWCPSAQRCHRTGAIERRPGTRLLLGLRQSESRAPGLTTPIRWPPPWSPASPTQRPSARGGTSQPGSVSCRSSTRAEARTSSAVSVNKAIAICAAWHRSLAPLRIREKTIFLRSLKQGGGRGRPCAHSATATDYCQVNSPYYYTLRWYDGRL